MQLTENSELILIIFIGTIAMVSLALGILFFFIFYQRRLHKNELHLNSIKAGHQKELLKNSLLAQESERKRFAEDLHDEVGALLSAIKLNLSRIERKAENNNSKELASETKLHLDDVISQIRRITRNLLPPSLERFGLTEAIKELANWVNKSKIIKIDVWHNDSQQRFAPKYEMVVYRIFQELINNSIKYSEGSVITVKLKFSGTTLFLSVSDNGKGFEVEKVQAKGLGLKNIESRLSLMNGKYKISSKLHKGTTTIIYVDFSEHL